MIWIPVEVVAGTIRLSWVTLSPSVPRPNAFGMDGPVKMCIRDRVTNPPIDAIREEIVTSTSVYVGEEGNILEEKPENCKILKVDNPILTNTDLLKIKYMKQPGFKVEVIPITYYKNTSLAKAIDRLFLEVDRAHRDGVDVYKRQGIKGVKIPFDPNIVEKF